MKNKIKVFRAIHSITQEELAEKMSVSRQTIYAIEKGNYSPSLELGLKIAQFFKEPLEAIFWLED